MSGVDLETSIGYAGRRRLAAASHAVAEVETRMLDLLGAQERDGLHDALGRCAEALEPSHGAQPVPAIKSPPSTVGPAKRPHPR